MAQPPSRRQRLETALGCLRGGKPREALEILDAELDSRPQDRDALFLSAVALEDLHRPEEALARYGRLISAEPAFEIAYHNRGLLLARLGRLQEAEQSHREYAERHPGSRQARLDLADVRLALSRYEEALAALETLPATGDASVLITRGLCHASLGNLAEATQCFSDAEKQDPSGFRAHVEAVAPGSDPSVVLRAENIFLWRGYHAQQACRWSGWDRYLQEFRRAATDPSIPLEPALSFAVLHTPLDAAERRAIAAGIARRIEAASPLLPKARANARDKLRIGILSPDFREHLNARLLLPLFELADSRRFELLAYSLAPDDGSEIRRRVQAAARQFTDLSAMDDFAAAQRIRSDQVDILVDAGGHTSGGRFAITARRPAPLQVLYLGFAASLGSSRIDYAIVDKIVAPNPDEWSEALVCLPDTYYLYDFREMPNTAGVSRAEYGLPHDAFVFCAFHKAEKISPDTFSLWMEMLRQTKNAVMWFLPLSEEARGNLWNAARALGIDPSRLHFAPFESRGRYLARQRLGDLLVDAVHHSAMTTACDALGAGLPFLTLRGRTMASRAGESLVRAAGLPEMVAADSEAFVRQAVALAEPDSSLAALRGKLAVQRQRAPLFDTTARVRQLEQAFLAMHERALRG